MLTRSRLTVTTALAAVAFAAPGAAMATPSGGASAADAPAHSADPRQQDMHASTVQRLAPQDRGTADARGEHAAALGDSPAVVVGDQRSPDAVQPFVRPVVVKTGAPASPGFDWTSAIIGIAGGLALAVLAGAAVSGGRPGRRHARTV